MLDPGPDEAGPRRARAGRAHAIEAEGTLKHENNWGLRKMAYEIEQRNEADYRWFRFEAPTELLDELSHNLKIADGVLRFRIFKVDPDSPVMVPPAAAARARRSRERRRAARRAPRPPPRAAGRRPAPPPRPPDGADEPPQRREPPRRRAVAAIAALCGISRPGGEFRRPRS